MQENNHRTTVLLGDLARRGLGAGLTRAADLAPAPPGAEAPFAPRALPPGIVHEVQGAGEGARGAATAFALALLAGAPGRRLLWILDPLSAREGGVPYGPGLAAHGFDPEAVLILRVSGAREALRAAEDGLSAPVLAAVLVELAGEPAALDETATRRLKLRAQASGVTGVLLRHGAAGADGLPVDLRWIVAPRPGEGAEARLLGRPAMSARLARNRLGRTATFDLLWEARHARFVPDPRGRAADVGARPHHAGADAAALRRAG
jgi:protein ImuA